MVMKAVAHIALEQLLDDIFYKRKINRRKKIKLKPRGPKVLYYVTIYGRRIRVLIKKRKYFYYGRLVTSPKWLAISLSKKEILAKILSRMSHKFEKCSVSGDFAHWNLLTGEELPCLNSNKKP